MKRIRTEGGCLRWISGTGALLLGACVAGVSPASAADPKEPTKSADADDATEDFELVNWVEFGVGGNFVKGDKAQFQQQKGVQPGAYGGLEGFHYEQPVDQKGIFSVDGRGIFDNHDYSVKLELSHPDKGFVRVGYTEYREYYDGLGGYLPSNGLIFNGLFNNELAVDRTHTFFEAGLTLPNRPKVTFRYDLETRDGEKDTTHWGQTTLTPGALQKKIVPGYRDLEETRHIFAVDVRHEVNNTEFGLGGRYDLQLNKDQRNVFQQPTQGTTARILTTDEGVNSDMYNVHAFTDTKLSDEWRFTTGYSFTTLHSVLTGDRVNTPIVTPLSATDTRFANLGGGSDLKQYVANLNLMYTPAKSWSVVPAIRIEKDNLDGASTDNVISGTAVQTISPVTQYANSEKGSLFVAESLDVRYTGFTNWVFYTRMEFSQDQSDLRENFGTNTLFAPTISRDTEWNRLVQKYSIGANWYPTRKVNFAAQYYHRMSDNNYNNPVDSTSNAVTSGDRYPAYLGEQDFDVDDLNLRATWRPFPTLTMVSRYDYQLSRVYTRPDQLQGIESATNRRHLFGEAISWTPINWIFVQANGNYVLDETHSPVEDLTGAMTGVVLSSPNNYWTAGGVLGFALDKKTDLQTSYSYYQADDYVNNSTVGMPYGAGARQHEVGATLCRRVSKNLRWTLRYAFSKYTDQTSGGAYNYEAHGIRSSIQYRF